MDTYVRRTVLTRARSDRLFAALAFALSCTAAGLVVTRSTGQLLLVGAALLGIVASATVTSLLLRRPAVVVLGTISWSLVLLRLPWLGETPTTAFRVLSLVPFAVCCYALTPRRGRSHGGNWEVGFPTLVVALYLALVIVASLRGGQLGGLSMGLGVYYAAQFSLLGLLAFLAFLRDSSSRPAYVEALCWAPVVYVATNVLLSLVVPAQDSPGTSATVLGFAGVSTDRVQFPLAGGVNAFGPIAGVALAVALTMAIVGHRRRLAVVGTIISLYAVLAIDSRGALLFAATAIVLTLVVRRARRPRLGWMAMALPIVPALILAGLAASGSQLKEFDRGSGESLVTATGRQLIWDRVEGFVSRPDPQLIVGWGQRGHVTSGVSREYAFMFAGSEDPLNGNAHNAILQSVLDIGWLGAVTFLGVAFMVLSRVLVPVNAPRLALFAGSLALLLIGTIEAAPTAVNIDAMPWWIMVVVLAGRVPPSAGTTARTATGRPVDRDLRGRVTSAPR